MRASKSLEKSTVQDLFRLKCLISSNIFQNFGISAKLVWILVQWKKFVFKF